ncbi:MAG: glycosyltransferase [Candidatus Lernaella stagnicola]|nr:glycosyltransferase [Candidatus Lernaella stagnicola]
MRFVRGRADCALVIPTRDRTERLLATLARLGATPGPDVEVVVVDNGSVDSTVARVRKAHPDIQVLEMGANRGMAARNEGATRAESTVVLMLDDDSAPSAGTLEKLLEALQDPSLGIAACEVTLPNGEYEEGGSRHVHIGCGAAMRRDVLLDLGGYHPEYQCYVDEYDLAYRVLAADLQVRYVDGAHVWHEPAQRKSLDYMIESLTSNNAYLATKFLPRDEALRFISWIVFRYGYLAAKRGAYAGFRRGLEALPRKVMRGDAHRSPLPERVLDLVLSHRDTAACFFELMGKGIHGIRILRAGKEIPGLIRAAQHAALEVDAIYEPPEGLFADVGQLFDIPVRPLAEFKPDADRPLVVGGTSPGFVRNTLALAKQHGLPAPLVP